MKTFQKLLLVKEMIAQFFLFQIIITSKKIKLIMIDLSKQQALNANPKSIQQINFTGRLKQAENTKIFYS